jgi:glutamate formiminotransferase
VKLVECVPNFSEGRDPAVVEEIVRALRSVPGVRLLDREMDPDHHRSVLTFAAPAEVVAEAAVRAVGRAAELIDLNRHSGQHPRIGAADVVPFVPLEGVTLEDCVAIARRAGEEIWRRFQIPVYYYEAAARDPERAALEKIRQGQFEGLREEVKHNPARRPDVGGPGLHPSAGAVVVGARKFLIAYNVYLDTPDVEVARRIARRIRTSSGGLPAVKALGVMAGGRAQVSMNLTDFEATPVHVAYEAVRQEAARDGVELHRSEIVGLVPRRALEAAAAGLLRIERFHPGMILETRLAQEQPSGLSAFLEDLAAPTPAPGGGSAAAAAGAMAASLGEMVAGLAAKKGSGAAAALGGMFRDAREFFDAAVSRDAAAYERVREAYRLPQDQRAPSLEAALQGAAAVPLEVLERVRAVAALLDQLCAVAPASMRSDLDTAAALLDAAARGARANAEINLADIREESFRRSALARLAPEVGST